MIKILKYSTTILLLLAFRLSLAQLPDIVALEYFYDHDPGFGNGEQIAIPADSLIDFGFDADISSVSSGFHILYFRIQDELGKWGLLHTQEFYIPPSAPQPFGATDLPMMSTVEYFYDDDPGYGNGVQISIPADSLIDFSFTADVSAVSSGFHILYFRIQDDMGRWGLLHPRQIYIPPIAPLPAAYNNLPFISAVEYFIDHDPGFGNGTPVNFSPDSIININFEVSLSELNIGMHLLYVRVKDENGSWNIAVVESFFKFPEGVPVGTEESLPEIIGMEYFFDADPGFGNGTEIPINADSLIDLSLNIDFSELDNGVHNLFIRAKDQNGVWSILFSDALFKFTPPSMGAPYILPNIISMEYYIDEDPGFGNGIEILNTPDSVINENLLAEIATISGGEHYLYLRVKDANNRWSHTTVTPFCVRGIQIYLEGAYDSNTGEMTTLLNESGLLPLQQPFNSIPGADWYYDGSEVVSSIPNENVVDWILVQARDAASPEAATSTTVTETQPGFLLKNGHVVGLDGESFISLSQSISQNLYLVVFHRNHLGVMSAFSVDFNGDCSCSYNFTMSADVVFGGENAHIEIAPGIWGSISGDGDGNGQVTIEDNTNAWAGSAGNTGFYQGDFNLDSQVNNKDKNEIWKKNNSKTSQIPE